MVQKKKMGGRLVPSTLLKQRIVRVNLSPRQVLSLKKGGSVTIKEITEHGTHELSLPEMDIKKMLTKLNRGVGARVSLNGGSIGCGMFDFLDPAKNGTNQFFTDTLPSTLIHDGIPLAGQVIGSVIGSATGDPLGSVVGSQIGKYGGQKLADYVGKETGRGIKRLAKRGVSLAKAREASSGHEFIGDGIFPAGVNLSRGGSIDMIQLGSPYIQTSSPAFHPYKQQYNPFASNLAVQQAPKSGRIIM